MTKPRSIGTSDTRRSGRVVAKPYADFRVGQPKRRLGGLANDDEPAAAD